MQTLLSLIVLMGKPAGGTRPIALMPMLYRIWTKIRQPYIVEWEQQHQGPWDAAIKGSSALRAAVIGALYDEVASLNHENVATILWDMEKFYDNIDLVKLTEQAVEVEYPIRVYTLGLQMHMSPRVVKAYDCNMHASTPTNGIIAGCVQSNYLARVLLWDTLQRSWDKVNSPSQTYLRSFVDDIRHSEYGRQQ